MAGAEVGERYRLMVDRIERLPWPIGVVGRLTGMLPADRVLRTIELSGLWHVPHQAAAAAPPVGRDPLTSGGTG